MIVRRLHRTHNRWPGFTLVEILLVLCIMVAMTGLVWPVLDKPFANQRLRKAAEAIRAEWCGARVEAMDSGQVYVFRYAVGGDRFRIECRAAAITADDPLFGDVLGDVLRDDSVGPGRALNNGAALPRTTGTLPDGVTFVAGQAAPDTRAAMIESETQQSGAAQADLSGPILFYPDGTTSTARLVLKNEHGRYIELVLRGLTGTVTVGELYKAEERLR